MKYDDSHVQQFLRSWKVNRCGECDKCEHHPKENTLWCPNYHNKREKGYFIERFEKVYQEDRYDVKKIKKAFVFAHSDFPCIGDL
jgi:hypothetical protein